MGYLKHFRYWYFILKNIQKGLNNKEYLEKAQIFYNKIKPSMIYLAKDLIKLEKLKTLTSLQVCP